MSVLGRPGIATGAATQNYNREVVVPPKKAAASFIKVFLYSCSVAESKDVPLKHDEIKR